MADRRTAHIVALRRHPAPSLWSCSRWWTSTSYAKPAAQPPLASASTVCTSSWRCWKSTLGLPLLRFPIAISPWPAGPRSCGRSRRRISVWRRRWSQAFGDLTCRPAPFWWANWAWAGQLRPVASLEPASAGRPPPGLSRRAVVPRACGPGGKCGELGLELLEAGTVGGALVAAWVDSAPIQPPPSGSPI